MIQPTLIKIGGHEIGNPEFLRQLADTIRDYPAPVAIVHGGGKEISSMQETMGITPQYIDGVRVTDADSLSVVEMVLGGLVNKRLVRYLMDAGVEATGMSGVDRGVVRAVKMHHPTQDMGFTGSVTTVRGHILSELLNSNIVPVIAPLCLGDDTNGNQTIYNVNADHVAGAVAGAVNAQKVIFVTNVEAVLDGDGQPISHLSIQQANALIEDGTINGGMIPKVQTALNVLESGVPQAVITNLYGLSTQGGTVFTVNQPVHSY